VGANPPRQQLADQGGLDNLPTYRQAGRPREEGLTTKNGLLNEEGNHYPLGSDAKVGDNNDNNDNGPMLMGQTTTRQPQTNTP